MREYGSIALVEGTSSTILEFMSGGGEIVASYYLWRAAKFPERSLQAFLPAIPESHPWPGPQSATPKNSSPIQRRDDGMGYR